MSNAEMERLLDRPMAITRREYNADMLTASKMGNAAAVAEARAPLMEALRVCQSLAREAEGELPYGLDKAEMDMIHEVEWRVQHIWQEAAAALAKETP